MKHAHVEVADLSPGQHDGTKPIQQSVPVSAAEEYDGEVADLFCLNESERFEEFVKRAEAAGKDDEAETVFNEHHLAHEEVFELQTARLIRIGPLFERQLDVAADRNTAGFKRASIRGFHDSWSTAGDHRITFARKQRRRFLGRYVIGIRG